MRQPCPASTSWSQLAACATACAPPCPDATPATITDTGDGSGCRFPRDFRGSVRRPSSDSRRDTGSGARPGRQAAADAAGKP